MERTLVAFTTLLLSAVPAQAAHLKPATQYQLVTSGRSARQVLPARTSAAVSPRAVTRTVYLVRDGALLWPGLENDAMTGISSIVRQPTAIGAWDIDDETWTETVACVKELYAPFDVAITDQDPGDVPHLQAIFGGHPSDVGLPDNVAGVSPFTEDCSVIERSVVFTFTDVLPDDARTMCEVMAQEIAHSYGLDHELLSSDPMTYLDHDGPRSFQDVDARCGEFEARPCGIGARVCRATQNSVQLLGERLGFRRSSLPPATLPEDEDTRISSGCSTTRRGGSSILFIVVLTLVHIRRYAPGRRGWPSGARRDRNHPPIALRANARSVLLTEP